MVGVRLWLRVQSAEVSGCGGVLFGCFVGGGYWRTTSDWIFSGMLEAPGSPCSLHCQSSLCAS
eukprot:4552257-Amphidinium_carterae.1